MIPPAVSKTPRTHAVARRDCTLDPQYAVPLQLLDLAFGDPPAIIYAWLPGLAPGQFSEGAAAAPKAHGEVVD